MLQFINNQSQMGKKQSWRKQKQDEIFHDDSEEQREEELFEQEGREVELFEEEEQQEQEPEHFQGPSELEEGELPSVFEEGEIASHPDGPDEPNPSEPAEQVYDSSAEDESHLQAEKRKREMLWRKREQEEQKMATFSDEDLLLKAFTDVERTNKRVMLMRKKNVKRMEDIEKVRMTQQPYLTSTNTHFRGSPGEYPLMTADPSGRRLLHPNYSLRVNQLKLGDFIQKNIREESSANYLNEVVKFQNYAYQQRKKRRQHIQ